MLETVAEKIGKVIRCTYYSEFYRFLKFEDSDIPHPYYPSPLVLEKRSPVDEKQELKKKAERRQNMDALFFLTLHGFAQGEFYREMVTHIQNRTLGKKAYESPYYEESENCLQDAMVEFFREQLSGGGDRLSCNLITDEGILG